MKKFLLKIIDFFYSLNPDPIWKYYVELNFAAQNIVLKKFDSYLQTLCKTENIKIKYFDTIEELNIERGGKDLTNRGNLAVGVYRYRFDEDNNLIINEKIPTIFLTSEYNVYTLAHELGHHFSIKTKSDNSEESADNFIFTFAEKYLTNLERYIINIGLKVYSKIEFELPKIKRSEWIRFKKNIKLGNIEI
jgi:hypothetical protein